MEPIQATQPTVSDKILDQRMTKAKMSFEAIQQLNLEQWASLKSSIDMETQLWKNCVIQRDWGPGQVGPDFECDEYGLPIRQPGVTQPSWVHNRRSFLQTLTTRERNVVLTGDPYTEFDPYTYILIYTYPEEVGQYPNILENFGHIIEARLPQNVQQQPEVIIQPEAPVLPPRPANQNLPRTAIQIPPRTAHQVFEDLTAKAKLPENINKRVQRSGKTVDTPTQLNTSTATKTLSRQMIAMKANRNKQ